MKQEKELKNSIHKEDKVLSKVMMNLYRAYISNLPELSGDCSKFFVEIKSREPILLRMHQYAREFKSHEDSHSKRAVVLNSLRNDWRRFMPIVKDDQKSKYLSSYQWFQSLLASIPEKCKEMGSVKEENLDQIINGHALYNLIIYIGILRH